MTAVLCEQRELDVASAPSPLGYLAVAVRNGRICGVSFGDATALAAEKRVRRCAEAAAMGTGPAQNSLPTSETTAEEALARLLHYAAGERELFAELPVETTGLTPFQRRVVAACQAIPYGETRTYGELAATAGSPGAARAVGQTMAANRVPLVVPCHRVVAASGKLGGFSAPQGTAMKRRLLAMEAAGAR